MSSFDDGSTIVTRRSCVVGLDYVPVGCRRTAANGRTVRAPMGRVVSHGAQRRRGPTRTAEGSSIAETLLVIDASADLAWLEAGVRGKQCACRTCFDAKYHYAFWRPITAIRAGDTDGNDATVGDPAWSTLLAATPNHPEYPSAHSCVTPAGGGVIARFLGTEQIDFTVPSVTGLGDRIFARAKDLQDEVGNARIWGGIHFRSAVEDGIEIGKKTANQVLAHHFKRSEP